MPKRGRPVKHAIINVFLTTAARASDDPMRLDKHDFFCLHTQNILICFSIVVLEKVKSSSTATEETGVPWLLDVLLNHTATAWVERASIGNQITQAVSVDDERSLRSNTADIIFAF